MTRLLEFEYRDVHGITHSSRISAAGSDGMRLGIRIPPEHVNAVGGFRFRARAVFQLAIGSPPQIVDDASQWSAWVNIQITDAPPRPPINLQPTIQQNRREPITVTWVHQPSVAGDTQTDSEVQFRQGDGAWTTRSGGLGNSFMIPAYTFMTEAVVSFRARTRVSQSIMWGAWSEPYSFTLMTINPPRPPTDLLPSSTQNPTRQIRLEWTHVPAEGQEGQDSQDGSEVELWQGSGARTILPGEFGNRVTLMPDTFVAGGGIVSFRARTHGLRGGWGNWSGVRTFSLALDPPLAPTNLAPESEDEQNRRTAINLSWRHTPNPADWDSQSDSEVEYWQGNDTRTRIMAGSSNRLELPSDTFPDNRTVNWRVRTATQRNGWGAWSNTAQFRLASFSPQAPINLAPTDTRNPRMPIEITWRHVPNERWFPNDGQTDSQVEVWQGATRPSSPHVFRGYGENRAIIPAGTFTALTPLRYQARTHSNLGGWGAWSTPPQQIPLAISPPLQPTELHPRTPQNPRGVIRISWLHTPNPDMLADEQTGSQVQVRQGNGAWRIFSGGVENVAYLPAHTFTAYTPVEFQARTVTAINGEGAWSASERFDLRMTPPLQPVLVHPVGIAVRAADGVFLQWSYNSPFDTFPSRFDIRYRIGSRPWVDLRTDSQGGLPAPSNITTSAETMQSRIEWQVRAWGELGDAGEWSSLAQAFIIGIPPRPTLTQITNSGRPQITFSAQNAMAWELEILQNAQLVYSTGERAFEGSFVHVAEEFFNNGNYTARLRISNEYGIYSEWATRIFTIAVAPPASIELKTANNLQYRTRLWFNGAGRVVYIYRAPKNDDFICIARVEDSDNFEDWTVQPGQRYKYFIRTVGANFSFADSNIETAKSDFMETTIAVADTPNVMVKLLGQLGGKPTKNSDFQQERTLTHFAGREKPVLQVGTHTDRTASLAFYVTLADRDRLEELAKCEKVLILRDWRLGTLYGTIAGGIQAQSDGFSEHCQISFSFTETDYPVEIV